MDKYILLLLGQKLERNFNHYIIIMKIIKIILKQFPFKAAEKISNKFLER